MEATGPPTRPDVKALCARQGPSSIMALMFVVAHAQELRELRETCGACSRRMLPTWPADGATWRCSSRCATNKARHASTLLDIRCGGRSIDHIEAHRPGPPWRPIAMRRWRSFGGPGDVRVAWDRSCCLSCRGAAPQRGAAAAWTARPKRRPDEGRSEAAAARIRLAADHDTFITLETVIPSRAARSCRHTARLRAIFSPPPIGRKRASTTRRAHPEPLQATFIYRRLCPGRGSAAKLIRALRPSSRAMRSVVRDRDRPRLCPSESG